MKLIKINEKVVEKIKGGEGSTISPEDGIILLFSQIALEPSADDSNHVIVTIFKDGVRSVLCVLDERKGMYQVPIKLQIFGGESLTVEVIGKGTIHMLGMTLEDGMDLIDFGEEL